MSTSTASCLAYEAIAVAARAGEPAFDRLEGLRPDLQQAPLLRDPALDQAGPFQHAQMSRYGRHADRERTRHLADRKLLRFEQPLDNGPARGIGQRSKDEVNAL